MTAPDEPQGEARVVVQPFDASVLISIWLDGFVSGVSSAAMSFNFGEAKSDALAEDMVSALQAHPAAMESVRNEVSERLRGIMGKAHNVTVFGRE